MKKLLVLALIAIFGAGYVKNHLGVNADAQSPGAGYARATLESGQSPEIFRRIGAILWGGGQAPVPASGPGQEPPRPAPSNVTASTAGSNGQSAAKGKIFGDVPRELLRFINPSLLTATPTGTQNLTPAQQQVLQQIIAQARANPTAFKEQYGAMSKALSGPR